jgi:hypothetical protein
MEENGYDGLTDDEDCACFLDDGFMDNSLICPLHCQAIHR